MALVTLAAYLTAPLPVLSALAVVASPRPSAEPANSDGTRMRRYVRMERSPAEPGRMRAEEERDLALLARHACGPRPLARHVADAGTPSTGPSPASVASPAVPPSASPPVNATIPPVPTPTAIPSAAGQPIYIVRGGSTPPPIPPAGAPSPTPEPIPSGAPTLPPGYVAILADKVVGNTHPGEPGDAIGNVHILYQAGELVGERAHYDGIRTVTVTGHPFIIDRTHDSILQAHEVIFDTIDQTAKLVGGRGESAQGVQRGLVYYRANSLEADAEGNAHGTNAYVTTCANPRGGYHITGKTLAVYPADKIVVTDAILWLGAAAVFFLPRIVIPLRSVQNETRRPSYFPQVGYDQYEGAWIKTQLGFGRDQYYYGYYQINYFTKVGLGLGYVGYFAKKNGRRSGSLSYYGIHDRRTQTSTYNVQAQEQENFSQRLRGTFGLTYQSNYGPLTNIPPNTALNGTIAHSGERQSQTYTFARSAVGSQSNTESFSFTDARQITTALSNSVNLNFNTSSTNYGGFASSNTTANVTTQTSLTTPAAAYLLTFNRNYSRTPYGDNKLPELQIRPTRFFPHFLLPLSAQFTLGDYDEPSNAFATARGLFAFTIGPALYRIFGSDFQATVDVNQYAYATGDLKAQISQQMSLQTPIGKHIVNSISYSEANYNGPSSVPFQFMDQLPVGNTKNAQDLLRFFNGSVYTLTLGFSTNFNAFAQPISYQLAANPSPRSTVLIGGSFVPGPGQGFTPSQLQFSTPFGRDTQLQFVGTIDWQNHERIENKVIYISKIIGDCYQLQVEYNQALKAVNVSVNLLAFPSQAANFGIGRNGPIIPTGFQF